MSGLDTVGPADAPWDTPDPLTCVRQLQSLVGLGFNVGHESAGDLQTLIQSAMGGIRKEVDLHMDFMGTEHVEHKTDHQLQRKMVRFWKCSAVTLHEYQTFYVGDTEPESDHVNYQWNQMKNLPGWWVKKIWHSYDGWLLVAKKEEFSLLVFDPPRQLDQRTLVEETISSEGSMESQRQTMAANMSKRAFQTFLHLPEDSLSLRPRSRSPRGDRNHLHPISQLQMMLNHLLLKDQQILLTKMVKLLCLWPCRTMSNWNEHTISGCCWWCPIAGLLLMMPYRRTGRPSKVY